MSTRPKDRGRLFLLVCKLTPVIATFAVLSSCSNTDATPSQQSAVQQAQFTSSGEVVRPDDWRSWMFVGTPLTPNALNGGEAPFPEFHNVYIEPTAFDAYKETGVFPDGTQLAKELVLVLSEGASEDGSTMQVSGRGYFQGEFQGLELAVKDTRRFADEPGGWAYFSFGHNAPPYAATAAAFPAESCNGCHEASAAKDWVFTQFYPVLRAN